MLNRSIVVAIAVLASSFSVSPSFARGANGGAAGAAGAAAGPGATGAGPVREEARVIPEHPRPLPIVVIDKKRCGEAFEGRAAYDFDDQSAYCKQ